LAVATVGGGSSPTLCLGLPFIFAAVVVLALLVGAACSEALAPQAQTDRQQDTFTADELKALQQKAEQGDATAQCNLGFLYRIGRGVPQDDALSVAWTRKAAEQGLPEAQYTLGEAYNFGRGVPQDYAQAIAWFRKAAEQGYAVAQLTLGMRYVGGLIVPKDYAQGVAWFRKAAEQGYAVAQFNLGMAYASGLGVPQDDVEAHKWLDLATAASMGVSEKKYADARDSLAKRMTPEQLAEAQKRASEWTAAFEKRKK
jgi:hypothetical protein